MHRNIKMLCVKCASLANLIVRKCSSMETNIQILKDAFGLPHYKAKKYLSKFKLKNSEELLDSINACKKLGYANKDILDNPTLLKVRPTEVIQHYLAMEEGGFSDISASTVAKARALFRKSICYLKNRELIHTDTDVVSSFFTYMNPKPERTKFKFTDEAKWQEVKRTLTEEYLKIRLQASQEDLIKFFRIHHPTQYKSFRVIQENIEVAESIGFTPDKILNNGYLLHNYPEYPKTVLKEFPYLVGMETKAAMKRYPKLVTVSPKNIVKIYGILKSFNISDEMIRNRINIFVMSPETIRMRLEEIQQTPELRILLKHPKLVSLLLHHNKTKSRLNFLQQLKLKCASALVLDYNTTELFDDYIKEGKDVNSPKDVLIFLKNLFNVPESKIKETFRRHPFSVYVPLVRMEETFRYLQELKYHRTSILKACYILLYPREKIELAVKQLLKNKEICFSNLSNVDQLNLILYHIEKEHHFTGNGIWRKSDNMSEPGNTLE